MRRRQGDYEWLGEEDEAREDCGFPSCVSRPLVKAMIHRMLGLVESSGSVRFRQGLASLRGIRHEWSDNGLGEESRAASRVAPTG
jgi:hypothetical protein